MMCEPAHSIVQYPQDFDDSNLPFGDNIDRVSRIKAALEKVGKWSSKIGKWFHISKMGAGHSAATEFGVKELRYLPPAINYEGFWWERTFEHDGWKILEKDEAYSAALQYHKDSCMGSMKKFRRFFEISLRKTIRLSLYLERFCDCVLNSKGSDALVRKLQRLAPGKIQRHRGFYNLPVNDKIIKTVMGYTRRRNLFVPEWADDDGFWE